MISVTEFVRRQNPPAPPFTFDATVEREQEKAVLLLVPIKDGKSISVWMPKSRIIKRDGDRFTVPGWLAKAKGISE
jgi:hypothetical protein